MFFLNCKMGHMKNNSKTAVCIGKNVRLSVCLSSKYKLPYYSH